ncbi:MAG: S1 RNA-binding domain-containing protein [Ilumatobacteraceae bacterium]|nr:S1 RNA-binding domain-containing protein [Ilumatobacteraceae bacterium]
MTTTSAAHYVVDGSNIATEGRSRPSLEQLQEAVTTFMADRPDAMITVVVDATFGHRIDASERPEFDEAVANNELVAPPAGAIGRGDAFVLTIADRAGASVLSNDSFQEFHGDYEWLFDEGRLVGGKPVPHVGWVFVERTPVRGPVSRKATKKSTTPATSSRRTASKRASEPMPVPKNPPPGATTRKASGKKRASSTGEARKAEEPVNDLIPFLEFVEISPVGARVAGVVDRYSSHGAYVAVGDVSVYVPLRSMADPPPKSARAHVKIGEHVDVTIVGFVAERRSVDGAFDGGIMEATTSAEEPSEQSVPARSKRAASKAPKTSISKTAVKTPAKKAAAKKAPAKKVAAKKAAVKKAVAKTPAKKVAAKKSAASAKKVTAKNAAPKNAATKKTAPKKTAAKKVATSSRSRKADEA